jgi:ribose 5-phosphate isomerase A
MRDNENEMKKAAAESAAALVRDGMVVGLGTGSTATFAVSELGRRVAEGLRIVGIPTSEATATQARSLGIPLTSLAEKPEIDLTIDGADEVEEGTLNLVKGLGGALLREKIVASASKRLVIVVHGSKLVSRLAASGPVPVEVVPFGWESTARRMAALAAKPALRRTANLSGATAETISSTACSKRQCSANPWRGS